jgi:phospholipid/cholesterol/gamma-HCH transport system substrate-binding protein
MTAHPYVIRLIVLLRNHKSVIRTGVCMQKLSPEAKVGLLVIVGSMVLLYMTFAVGKYQVGEKRGYILQADFDSVAGLNEKSAVRMAGVKIGVVEKVELVDSRARVSMRIDPEVRIKRGTQAMIKTLGLLGEKYVEFLPGQEVLSQQPLDERSSYYQPDERVRATVSPSDVDKLIGQLSAISDDIKQVTGSLRQVFGTERGARSMEDILSDFRSTMANVREFSHTLRSDGGELVMRLNELVASLNGVVGENRENLKVTMENVREASKSAELALAAIEKTTQKIERGEGTIGKLLNDDSMYNNIDTAAKGLGDYVSRIERIKTTIGFRSEYMFPQAKSYATLEIKPRPDQYYILELTNDPFGKYHRTVQTTTPGNTIISESFSDSYEFSVEFAKRWGNFVARLGLIESTGGAGVDYFAFDDKLKFSFDAWNFSSKEQGNENAHLKATVSLQPFKYLFVNAGYDNFLNARRKAPFIGVGLKFDDEDLKYLLGSVPLK